MMLNEGRIFCRRTVVGKRGVEDERGARRKQVGAERETRHRTHHRNARSEEKGRDSQQEAAGVKSRLPSK